MKFTSAVTYPFRAAGRFLTRNFAFSDSFIARMKRPVFNSWTIRKAVKEGYRANGWVYRAVTLTMKSGASVPWGVVDKDEKRLPEHHLDKMLQMPNPHLSRKMLFELWISWLELGGNALSQKVKSGNETIELWPISPDRIHPVTTNNIQDWIAGYSFDNDPKIKWDPEEILYFKYIDPANPLIGIGPLQAAAVTVDVDTDMKAWNKSAMQNMGVLSGVFSFKRTFSNPQEAEDLAESMNDRWAGTKNARRLGVVGGEAKYTRISATPQELDFGNSRINNRDEIFIIFGIPIQYAGATEASTYNNYQTSELIFWFQKIIPLMDDLKDMFNLSFRDELEKGEHITYFLEDVAAIRRALLERAKTARLLFNMGVPFSLLNKVFKFGIDEYAKWDESFPGGGKGSSSAESITGERSDLLPTQHRDIPQIEHTSPFAKRDVQQEVEDRENWSKRWAVSIEELLAEQSRLINIAIETASDEQGRVHTIDVQGVLGETWEAEWTPVYNNITRGYAVEAADQILVIDTRATDVLKDAIEEYLENERIVLTELSLIEPSTVNAVIVQVESSIAEGLTVNQLQQAIIDAGIFEPARALRLSRTITGTAGSIGQFVGARETGATHKKWVDSGFEVRDEHVERNAEPAVGINARYSPKFGALIGPRYPLDQEMPAGDRINCRCSQTFEIRI